MRYLITGGCGFLGSNIAAKILADKHELLLFDNMMRAGSDKNLEWLRAQGNFTFFHGDTRHHHDVETAIRHFKPQTIFHLAGQVAMTTSIERPRFDFEINTLGTLNILEVMRTYCPDGTIIYSSTNKVYGDLEQLHYEDHNTRYVFSEYPFGIPETIHLDFQSPYGCSKGAADQYILDYSRIFGIKGVVFRHSSMYGGRQFSTKDQGWIGWFCQKALEQAGGNNESFTISGNGKQVRDLLHADDMVALYLKAADSIDNISGQAFNIGGGPENSLSILELLHFLERELNCTLTFEHIASRASDQKIFIADIRKIQQAINWQPVLQWQEGIRRMLIWIGEREMIHG